MDAIPDVKPVPTFAGIALSHGSNAGQDEVDTGEELLATGAWSGAGFMRPVSLVIGDLIGLEGEARTEKRRIYGSAVHTRWAAQEVQAWPATSALGREAGGFPADLPVAVVTAGDERTGAGLKALQVVPAQRSRRGYVDHVKGANHASLLGKGFADPIVRGVEHVLAQVRR